MTTAKSVHYEQQLLSALCRGAWLEGEPGKSPKAVGLNWTELIRKYRKHNPDSALATVAVQTQTLALLLARSRAQPPPTNALENGTSRIGRGRLDLDGDSEGVDNRLNVGQECILDAASRPETDGNVEELSGAGEKGHTDDSIRLTFAYYAYARGDSAKCIEVLSGVDLDAIPPPERSKSVLSSGGRGVPIMSTGSISEVIAQSGAIAGSPGASVLSRRMADATFNRVWWVTERVRSRCLQGMSYELLGDTAAALRSYDAGVGLLEELAFKKPDGNKTRSESFAKYRELWRWSERLLWRAAVVSARVSPVDQALRILRSYHLHSQYWTPNFRPFHRSTVYTVYIRALCLSTPLEVQAPLGFAYTSMPLPVWYRESREALEEYKAVLQATTVFPRAGEVNHKVVDFSDLCIAIWEKGGESEDEASWMIDLMWWTTTLTFHSHRVMRHLTRLLIATGNVSEAKRTFHLYVQLVTKARQTSAGDVSLQLKRRPTGDRPAGPGEIAKEEGFEEERGAGQDSDGDRVFVCALTLGVHMLSRWCEDDTEAREAWQMAELAKAVLDGSKHSRDQALHAKVKTAAGIARGVQAAIEMEPETRPSHQAAALELLRAACTLEPSADALYELAYMQAESRDIHDAVLSARQAVEKNPRSIPAWHLLGLLLTAENDYRGALAVLKLGLDEAAAQEQVERDRKLSNASAAPVPPEPPEGVSSRDYGTSRTTGLPPSPNQDEAAKPETEVSEPIESVLLYSDQVPLGYTLHNSFAELPSTRAQRFESTLQLLITRNTIIELLEGPESSSSKWLDIFSYFSEKYPALPLDGSGSRRGSFETATSVVPTPDSSRPVEALSTVQETSSLQIPQVVTHPPPETNGEEGEQRNGRDPTPRNLHRGGRRGGRSHNHRGRDGQRVDLSEFRMRSQKLLQGGQKQLQTLSRKIIHRDGNQGGRLPRSSSVPDFSSSPQASAVYQASSIHSRIRRLPSPSGRASIHSGVPGHLSVELVSPSLATSDVSVQPRKTQQETRLLSDLWLLSGATFRRMQQLDQAHGAIQEAESLDPENPNVWVQLGLYFAALDNPRLAIESFHKALVIEPENIPASIHLAQQYLSTNNADLAAGLLSNVTQGAGWDVAEAWYFLAKACEKQGRRERERECLVYALKLEETKTIRPLAKALPRCF